MTVAVNVSNRRHEALRGHAAWARAHGRRHECHVLGETFEGRPLHQLLLEAVRHGEKPEVRRYLRQVIDERVGEVASKLPDERALHHHLLTASDVRKVRVDPEEARARPL
jgi:hypothetical protein